MKVSANVSVCLNQVTGTKSFILKLNILTANLKQKLLNYLIELTSVKLMQHT